MNRFVTTALITFLPLVQATFALASTLPSPADSVGVERREGKRFALHRVDQGQTLYAVARRYHVAIDAIRAANPDLADNSLRFNQLLRVPLTVATVAGPPASRKEQRDAEKALKREEKDRLEAEKEAVATAEPTSKSDKTAAKTTRQTGGTHVVETGQTLYSLAVRYNVTMADLRQWNELGVNGIQVGQSLFVTEKAYETKQATDGAKPKPVAKPADSELVKLETKPIIMPEPVLTPGSKPKPKTAESKPVNNESLPAAVTTKRSNVKSEVGFAELITGNDASTKYLALHRSAPVGTLVQVRNDITNQSLYVKIIGRLPDTGINNQVLIRLSGRAFEKLSPNGQRFRAEVSYTN